MNTSSIGTTARDPVTRQGSPIEIGSRFGTTVTDRLVDPLVGGINEAGVNVIDIGMTDTPQLYFAVNHLGTCGTCG